MNVNIEHELNYFSFSLKMMNFLQAQLVLPRKGIIVRKAVLNY